MSSPEDSYRARGADCTFLVVGFLLTVALWLATRPYLGIFHDSRFYTVQGLNAFLPDRFSNDLYFQYGSQDQFTIFTRIYAPFIAVFGLSRGNLILALLSQILWLSGAAFLAGSLTQKSRATIYALGALVVLPGGTFLHYGEPFLTPRIVTEALTFWGLGCMLRRQLFRACAIFFLSIFVHPLMALPGIALFFLFEAIRKPLLWIVAALGTVVIFCLALLGIQPFSRLLISFDPAWLRIAELRDFWCFVSKWNFETWTLTLNSLLLSAFALLYLKERERLFLILSLIVAVCGTLATLIGGDLFHNVMVVDAQQWRGIWLLSAVTNFFVGKILFCSGDDGPKGVTRILFSLTAFSVAVSAFVEPFFLFVTPLCVLGLLVHGFEYKTGTPLPKAGERLIVVFLSVILAFALIAVKLTLSNLVATPAAFLHCVVALLVCTAAVVTFVILFRYPSTAPRFLVYVAGFLLIISAANWDQRTPWIRFVDTTSQPPADLVAALPANGSIYWEGDVAAPWFLLKRDSQFSCDQGTGVLFSRGTALAYQARYQVFARLGTLDFEEYQFCPMPESPVAPAVTQKNLVYVCQNQPGLGALVLTTPAPDTLTRIWVAPVTFQATRQINGQQTQFKTNKFYIYRCSDLLHLPVS